MARNKARPGRTVTVFFIGLALCLRPGRPDRHLEARARPRPRGRHPDRADRQGHRCPRTTSRRPPASSTAGSTARASARRRSPPRAATRSSSRCPAPRRQPRPDRRTPGTAPVPPGRAGAAEHHHDAAALVLRRRPAPGVTKPAKPEPVDVQGHQSPRQEPPAGAPGQGQGQDKKDDQTPTKAKATSSPSSNPSSSPTTAPGNGGNVPDSTSQVTLHPGEPEGLRGRPHLADQPRPAVGGGLQRLHLPAGEAGGRRPDHPAGHL